jgi:hypothetical protein
MSRNYSDDTPTWCDEHAVERDLCGCSYSDPRGSLWERLLTRSQLDNLPDPQPLIHETLDRRTTAMLAGNWGTGKTFLALDWSLCVATGKPWQGRQAEQGPVVYIAAEGAYGIRKRVKSWEVAWHQDVKDDAFYVIPTAVQVGSRDVRQLVDICQELNPSLVVIDTLARCFVGFEENSNSDMGVFVSAVDRIRDSINGGTVLTVHHTGKDGKTIRGGSALEGAMDSTYLLQGDSHCMRLERIKRKDGPTPDQFTLRLEEIPGTDSVVVSGARGVDTTPTVERIMSTYVQLFSASGATKAELRAALDMSPSSFHRGVNRALEQGFLMNTGTDQRPFYKLGAGYE